MSSGNFDCRNLSCSCRAVREKSSGSRDLSPSRGVGQYQASSYTRLSPCGLLLLLQLHRLIQTHRFCIADGLFSVAHAPSVRFSTPRNTIQSTWEESEGVSDERDIDWGKPICLYIPRAGPYYSGRCASPVSMLPS